MNWKCFLILSILWIKKWNGKSETETQCGGCLLFVQSDSNEQIQCEDKDFPDCCSLVKKTISMQHVWKFFVLWDHFCLCMLSKSLSKDLKTFQYKTRLQRKQTLHYWKVLIDSSLTGVFDLVKTSMRSVASSVPALISPFRNIRMDPEKSNFFKSSYFFCDKYLNKKHSIFIIIIQTTVNKKITNLTVEI